MQKLYWLFVINFTSPKSYYIWQLLTIGHDYPVPVDKHYRDQNFTPLTPKARSKVEYFYYFIFV